MTGKIGFMCATLVAGFFFIQCLPSTTAPENGTVRELSELEKTLVRSSGDFGLKLFKKVDQTEGNNNIFVSPLSISMALGMTLNGANGMTKDEMEQTLELAGLSVEDINQSYQSLIQLLTGIDPKVQFQIANSIWYRQGMTFEQDFIDLNKTWFNARVAAVDFNNAETAAALLNSWVSENTNDRIKKIVEPADIDGNTVMFLMNAIYFKGTWTYQFDKSMTRMENFSLPDGTKKPVLTMHLNGDLDYMQNEFFRAVDLPYGDGKYSMMILAPGDGVEMGAMIAQLSGTNWQNWINEFSKQTVALTLPKFKLEYEIRLNDVLIALGMRSAFYAGQADFTRMQKTGGLFISEVKHKTFVEVDENGTEAAAVTSVEIGMTSVSKSIQMRIDRPFVFAIREHNSNSILFIGKIVDPG